MNNPNFFAHQWFKEHGDNQSPVQPHKRPKTLPPFQRRLVPHVGHNLQRYLNPGWNGQSLCTKKYFKALHHLETLQGDLLTTFRQQAFPPKQLKVIYAEFAYYGKNHPELQALQIHSPQQLAQALQTDQEHQALLEKFLFYYSARLIMLYFLQLRLLKTLQPKLNITEDMRDLLSPPLALAKIFPKGTHKEIHAGSLETNQYSWYRPAAVRLPQVSMLYRLSAELSYSETLKLLYALQGQEHGGNYSHALSHLGTGLFLNCLQVNFPCWNQMQRSIEQVQHVDLAIKSSLYTGDYLEELAVSHWLAQDNNKTFAWDQILCPQFISTDAGQHHFERYYNELQFLQLLTEVHAFYKTSVVEFIAQTFKQWLDNLHLNSRTQTELFENNVWERKCQYDQVILSVLNFTKNNPHHFLVQKISQQVDLLKEGGQLIVLSKQNLFLPSQRERVDQMLKKLEPMAIFNFDQLSGRGEIPDHLYIFKKRTNSESHVSTSQACITFRFHGELNSFQNFCHVPEELNSFFQKFTGNVPAFYQTAVEQLKFESFQDALVNGLLLHSNDQQGQHITHPSFLRKLLNNALPLNYYFDISHIDGKTLTQTINDDWNVNQQLPFASPVNFNYANLDELALILDLRDASSPCLELSSKKILKAKAFEYGISECYYYYLQPKVRNINLSFLAEYFRSSLGKQICAISLLGHKHQIRSKLHTLLIPNLLIQKSHQSERLQVFNLLSKASWEQDQNILNSINNLGELEAGELVSLINILSPYVDYIQGHLHHIEWEKSNLKEFNFNTPSLRQALMSMPLSPLYPHNPEIQIDFLNPDYASSQTILSKHELYLESLSGKIILYSANTAMISIKAAPALLVFIHFLLKKLPPQSAIDFLTKIKVPSEKDCSTLIRLKDQEALKISDLKNAAHSLISKILQQGIVK